MKKIVLMILGGVAVFGAGMLTGANKYNAPSTILHVSTVKWKADSTQAQRAAGLEGIKTMAAEIPGIKNIWIKKTKVQPADYNDVFAIEFENRAAADAYIEHPAHKAWEKIYIPAREESRNVQVTN